MKRLHMNRCALGLWLFALLLHFTISDELALSSNDCCKNGGVCMLKSFCVCSPEFYGRHCEYQLLKRSCTKQIKHGTWLRSDCDLCWCYDGTFRCQLRVFRGCGDSESNYVLKTDDILDARREIYVYPSLSNGNSTACYFTSTCVFISLIITLIGCC